MEGDFSHILFLFLCFYFGVARHIFFPQFLVDFFSETTPTSIEKYKSMILKDHSQEKEKDNYTTRLCLILLLKS